jgi:4a-hydroxytetrahydrobiopterin dehydratase
VQKNLRYKYLDVSEFNDRPLTVDECFAFVSSLSGWSLSSDNKLINEFTFKTFGEALNFVNNIGKIAEKFKHHPDIFIHNYSKVTVSLQTHSIKRLSAKDFALASKIDKIFNT